MTTTSTPRALPWIKYSGDVDRQIEAGIRRDQARGTRTRTVNGAPTYRDPSTRESYTVGYGGERTYSCPATPVTTGQDEATVPMKNLIDALLVERQYTDLSVVEIEKIKKNKPQAKRFIKFLIDLPKVPARPVVEAPVEVQAPAVPARARLDFSTILDGNYAIPGEGDEIKFYRVASNTGADGRIWKNVQIRASDSLYPTQFKQGVAILHKIVEFGLAESQMLFATKLERCWMCGRSLTNEVSRARGTGDECASK